MDFFQSQDDARRNTTVLLVLFIAAVLTIVVLTNILILGVASFQDTNALATGQLRYSWETFLLVGLGVVLLIGLGSLFRIFQLSRGGGKTVAEMLNGELLVDPGDDLARRRLLNIVEEMAIASGTPVPPVYVIPESSINAFAAGYAPGDAIIGVTQGTIDALNRDQLQGVIAHEFSHILNGDMRLNIRLMGVLYGILMLAIIGRSLLSSRRHRTSSSQRDSGGAIIMIGLGLFVIGYAGKFFGTLIKAAVSRQREFLADASSVQFTRNPDGIAGALMRIGGFEAGSRLENSNSEELSHAFFAEGVKFAFAGLMSTHPPITDRIKRINPRWDGEYITSQAQRPEDEGAAMQAQDERLAGFAGVAASAEAILEGVGNPGADQLAMARDVLSRIPAALLEAVREPYSCRAVVYLVLLDRDAEVRSQQIDQLEDAADLFVFARFRELLDYADEIEADMRLPLLEMAMPRLQMLSAEQQEQFTANLDALIDADKKVGLSEWALRKFVTRHLEEAAGRRTSVRFKSFDVVLEDCRVLLSMLAWSDRSAKVTPEVAFGQGREELEESCELLDRTSLRLDALDSAVDRLAALHPLRKPKLLKACVATVLADRRVSPVEAELLRAISDALDCPMPPIVTLAEA
jgi:Zn-dependent protease with chaperone function